MKIKNGIKRLNQSHVIGIEENNKTLRSLFEESRDAIAITDRSGKILEINRAGLDLFDVKKNQILGCKFQEFYVYAEDAYKFRDLIEKSGSLKDYETRLAKADGTQMDCLLTVSLMKDAGGKVVGYQGIIRDETARKSAEEALRVIFNSVYDAIFLHDINGKIIDVNDKMLEMYRVDRQQALKFSIKDDYSTKDNPFERLSEIWEKVASGKDEFFEWRARRPTEETSFDVEVFLRRITLRNNYYILANVRDISARKKAELALLESEERYRSVFENTGTATVIIEEDGEIVMANTEFEKLSGYSKQEIEGSLKWTDFVIKEDLDKMMEFHVRRRKSEDGIPSEYEFRFTDRNGEQKDVYNRVSLIPGTQRSVASLMDITHIKKVEQALRASEDNVRKLYEKSRENEEVYRSLIRSSADPIVIYDMEGKCRYLSPAFTELFGWTLEELEGRRISFVPDDEKDETFSTINDVVTKGIPTTGYETKRFTKDGHLLDISISASRYLDHKGDPAGLLVILRNITESKRIENQLREAQKMEAIGTLAGGIAHEFNNTLTALTGNIELLRIDLEPNNNAARYTESMRTSIKRMKNLTDQLLAYAQGGKYRSRIVSMNDLVEETLQVIRHNISDSIRLETDLDSDIHSVEADMTQMQMVISAVVINAAEAIEGKGKIRLITRNMVLGKEDPDKNREIGPGPYGCFKIVDDGKGMDYETKARMFDPFFSTKFQGRGLGMAAVYGIVRNHGGFIKVDSEIGRGTEVAIFLPATGNLERRDKPMEKSDTEKSSRARTILIIEDEDMIMDATQAMLEKLGYKVLCAKTGKKAIEIARTLECSIDLAILDVVLPDMGGKEIYSAIMESRPTLKVIIFSGYSIDGPAREILEKGAQSFIQKPFSFKDLTIKIREIIGE